MKIRESEEFYAAASLPGQPGIRKTCPARGIPPISGKFLYRPLGTV